MRQIIQDLVMAPMHAMEGVAVRWRFAGWLYRILSLIYQIPRPYIHAMEDEFQKQLSPGDRLLDIGCGTGYLTKLLEDRSMCIGLDLTHRMLSKAGKFAPHARFVQGDMTQLPFISECFNAVVSLGAIHCADYALLTAEINRVLSHDGEVHLLIDDRVIPRFALNSSSACLKSALSDHGFDHIKVFKKGLLYKYVKARKSATFAS